MSDVPDPGSPEPVSSSIDDVLREPNARGTSESFETRRLKLDEQRFAFEKVQAGKALAMRRCALLVTVLSVVVAAATLLATIYWSDRRLGDERIRSDKELRQQRELFYSELIQQLKLSRASNVNRFWEEQLALCGEVLESAATLTVEPKGGERRHFKVLMRGRTGILQSFDNTGLRSTMDAFLDRIDKCGADCDQAKYCVEAMACYCHKAMCNLFSAGGALDAETEALCKSWDKGACAERDKRCRATGG